MKKLALVAGAVTTASLAFATPAQANYDATYLRLNGHLVYLVTGCPGYARIYTGGNPHLHR